MKTSFTKQRSIAIYCIFLLITCFLAYDFNGSPNDNRFESLEAHSFATPWFYDYLNGISGMTTLPNDLPQTDSHTLILKNKIPTLTTPTSFFFRARHTSVKIYLDDKLMIDSSLTTNPSHSWFGIEGIFYYELFLTHPLASCYFYLKVYL